MTVITDLLRGSALFGTLPDSELERIAPVLREESYAKGERVIAEGEKGDSAYLIATGQADVVTRNLVGEEVTLRTFVRSSRRPNRAYCAKTVMNTAFSKGN